MQNDYQFVILSGCEESPICFCTLTYHLYFEHLIMEKITYRLVYNRKKHLNKEGKALVQVEAYQERRRMYFSTKVYLTPGQWDKRRQLVRNHPQAEALNRLLHDSMNRMEGCELALWRPGRQVSLEMLRDAMAQNHLRDSFADFFCREAEKAPLRPSTRRAHLDTLRQLRRFHKGRLGFGELTAEFVNGFERFLLADGLHVNTVAKHLAHLRRYVYLAETQGLLAGGGNIFRHRMLKRVEGRHTHLTPEELLALERLTLHGAHVRWRKTLDAFLFCCYAGLRYSDFTSLGTDNLAKVNGKLWLVYRSVKTGVPVRLPLYLLFGGKALALIQKYSSDLPGFFSLPHNSNVNKTLASVAALAGLRKRVTFHTARHTNATLLIYKGVNITTVQRLLGHKSVKTTQIYAKVMDCTLVNDLQRRQ